MEEKCPYVRKKMGTNFLGSPNSMDFTAFSHAMENWLGNPCISHIIMNIIMNTIECESNWKKAPIQWGEYEYQFPRFSTYDGFCSIFPEITFSGFSHSMDFPAISNPLGNWWETHAFPIWWSIPQDGNLMEQTTHFTKKVWESIC